VACSREKLLTWDLRPKGVPQYPLRLRAPSTFEVSHVLESLRWHWKKHSLHRAAPGLFCVEDDMAMVVADHTIRNASDMAAWIGIDGAFVDVGYWTTAVSKKMLIIIGIGYRHTFAIVEI
jgi:hypothetical protein